MSRGQIKSVGELAAALDDIKKRIDWSDFSFDVPVDYDVKNGKFVAPDLDQAIKKVNTEVKSLSRQLRDHKSAWLEQTGKQKLLQAFQDDPQLRQSFGAYLAQEDASAELDNVPDKPADVTTNPLQVDQSEVADKDVEKQPSSGIA